MRSPDYPGSERIAHWIARHLPRRVAYWAYIRVAVYGNPDYPGDQKVLEPMKRWTGDTE